MPRNRGGLVNQERNYTVILKGAITARRRGKVPWVCPETLSLSLFPTFTCNQRFFPVERAWREGGWGRQLCFLEHYTLVYVSAKKTHLLRSFKGFICTRGRTKQCSGAWCYYRPTWKCQGRRVQKRQENCERAYKNSEEGRRHRKCTHAAVFSWPRIIRTSD